MGRKHTSTSGAVSNAHELRQFMSNRMWRTNSRVVLSIGAALISLFVYQLFFATSSSSTLGKNDFVYVDLTSKLHEFEVFQSGKPWLVLCLSGNAVVPKLYTKTVRKLQSSDQIGSQDMHFGILDCNSKFQHSGMSVMDKFGLKNYVKPLLFTVANGNKPRQLFQNDVKSSKILTKAVIVSTKKLAKQVMTSKSLENYCTKKRMCVMILRSAKIDKEERLWFDRIMHNFPPKGQLANLPKFTKQKHRMVVFKNEKKGDKLPYGRIFQSKDFEYMPIKTFLDQAVADDVQNGGFQHLKSLPKLSSRPKPPSPPRVYKQPDNSQDSQQTTKQEPLNPNKMDDLNFPQQIDSEDDSTTTTYRDINDEDDEEEIDLFDE